MRDFVQQIFDVGPTATPLMTQINGEADALLGLVKDFQANVERKQTEVETLNGRVEEGLAALQAKVAEQQALLEQQTDAVSDKTDELKSALDEVKTGVISALETAQQQMEEFRSHVDSGRELVEAANQTCQGVVEEVTGHVEEGRQLMHQATDYANDQIDGFQAKIDETFELTEATASNLIEQVDSGIRDTGAKVEEMVGMSFEDMASTFTAGMELVQGNVIENGVNAAMDELQGTVEEQLNTLIDQLLEQVVGTLGNVRESLFGNAEEASLERKALEPILDQLGSILDPLFDAVDHVKGMASMVGIDV